MKLQPVRCRVLALSAGLWLAACSGEEATNYEAVAAEMKAEKKNEAQCFDCVPIEVNGVMVPMS